MTELELAAACANGDRAALSTLQKTYLPRALESLRVTDTERAEVSALVLERLLVREGGQPARIAQFTGKGPLVAWLRMIASRVAIDLKRRAALHTGLDGRDAPDLRGADAELQLIRGRHAREFEAALTATLTALPTREGNVLQLHFLEGLSASAIGAMYKVHGRTVQRWILDARTQIVDEVRKRLKVSLGLSDSQLDSLVGALQSHLDVSIRRLLPGKAP
ncbi:MAG: sigma-70 family RNA polymerase sigma factor [Archangiaceae bacterium]|nr:sigma-70 family RNA polymerase sigma factor [Archangiaceae bacterium]